MNSPAQSQATTHPMTAALGVSTLPSARGVFWGTQSPHRDYAALIRSAEDTFGGTRSSLPPSGPLAWEAVRAFNRLEVPVKESLRGRILVDLGSGQSHLSPLGNLNSRSAPATAADLRTAHLPPHSPAPPLTPIQLLAETMGASGYVAVERFFLSDDSGVYSTDPEKNLLDRVDDRLLRMPEQMRMALVQADMLDFLSRLPDGSANICINAIDCFVIPSDSYHRALSTEISRVVPAGGVAFGINAQCLETAPPGMSSIGRRSWIYRKD